MTALTDYQIWYREVYLKSEHWKALRAKALDYHGKICFKCKSKGPLDVHHLRYRKIYDVLVTDLQVLCRSCHEMEHKPIQLPEFTILPKSVQAQIHSIIHTLRPCGAKARKNTAINQVLREMTHNQSLTPEMELDLKCSKTGATARYYRALRKSGLPADVILTSSRRKIRKLLANMGSQIEVPRLGGIYT